MSTIVEFFAAADDASAALALSAGPQPGSESLSFGNFDPTEAVVEWECLLVGGSPDELVAAGEPRLVGGEYDGGGVVLALSPRLSAALAGAGRAALRDAAAAWSSQRAEYGEVIDGEIAEAILTELADLVSSARGRGEGVYCWVA
ncbi:hypothetical protein [Streptomyces sp. NPDC050560]|uniref:hypothetical protein n=1 Tax=Streptomyces sp. NPDC050560 TaxID=3365630 RepID=UPI00378F0201